MDASAALIDRAHTLLTGIPPAIVPFPNTDSGLIAPVGPRVRRLSSIEEREIQWIWPSTIPRGMLTLLGALPGVGKSTLTAWLAATLSRGGILPDGSRAPKINTLMLLAEDSFEYTTKARLRIHDADEDRIFEFTTIGDINGNEQYFNLRDHIEDLRQVVQEYDIGLIIIDPISSFMPRADRNSEGDVRDLLGPLLKMIDESNVGLIAIVHVGKSTDKRVAQQMIMGSTAFTAVARVVIMTADIPDDSGGENTKKVFQVVKSNIDVKPPALAWSRKLDAPIEWHGPSSVSFEEATASASRDSTRLIDLARGFILDETRGGSRYVTELESEAEKGGISNRTFRRAREALKAEGKIEGYKESKSGRSLLRWPIPKHDHLTNSATSPDTENMVKLANMVNMSHTTSQQHDHLDHDGQHLHADQLAMLDAATSSNGGIDDDEELL